MNINWEEEAAKRNVTLEEYLEQLLWSCAQVSSLVLSQKGDKESLSCSFQTDPHLLEVKISIKEENQE